MELARPRAGGLMNLETMKRRRFFLRRPGVVSEAESITQIDADSMKSGPVVAYVAGNDSLLL